MRVPPIATSLLTASLLLPACLADDGRDGGLGSMNGGGKGDEIETAGTQPEQTACDYAEIERIQSESEAASGTLETHVLECGAFEVYFIDEASSIRGYDNWVITADLSEVELVIADPTQPSTSVQTFGAEHRLFAAINGNLFGCYVSGDAYVPAAPTKFPDRCPEATRGEVGEQGPVAYRQYPMGLQCGDGTCFDNSWENQEGVDTSLQTHVLVTEDVVGQVVRFQPPGGDEVDLGCAGADGSWPLYFDCEVGEALSGHRLIVTEGRLANAGVDGEFSGTDASALTGAIPFVGASEDGRRIFIGVSRSGLQRAGQMLVDHFGEGFEAPVWHAVMLDSGGSPNLWLGDANFFTVGSPELLVPVRVGLRERP